MLRDVDGQCFAHLGSVELMGGRDVGDLPEMQQTEKFAMSEEGQADGPFALFVPCMSTGQLIALARGPMWAAPA